MELCLAPMHARCRVIPEPTIRGGIDLHESARHPIFGVSRGLGPPQVGCVWRTNSADRLPAFIARETARPIFLANPSSTSPLGAVAQGPSAIAMDLWVTEGGFFFGRANGTKTVQRAAQSKDGRLLLAALVISSTWPPSMRLRPASSVGTAAPAGELLPSLVPFAAVSKMPGSNSTSLMSSKGTL
jgi:hypothetical protein